MVLIYCEVKLGKYVLKQAAILVYNQQKSRLALDDYYQLENTDGVWEHTTGTINFALCVDDFGIKYHENIDIEHLITALKNTTKFLLTKQARSIVD